MNELNNPGSEPRVVWAPSATKNYTSNKLFEGYPCAHREWQHEGHCRFVHGYSRAFHIVFVATRLDERGWVCDFSDLKWIHEFLTKWYDHTLLIAETDPALAVFKHLDREGLVQLRIPHYGPGMESTARFVCEQVSAELSQRTKHRVRVYSVEAIENEKNSATFVNPFFNEPR